MIQVVKTLPERKVCIWGIEPNASCRVTRVHFAGCLSGFGRFPLRATPRLSAAIILPGSRISSPELAARSSANETPQAWEGRPASPVGPPTTLIPTLAVTQTAARPQEDRLD